MNVPMRFAGHPPARRPVRHAGAAGLLVAALILPGTAWALLAPEYYAEARRNAADVIVIGREAVVAPAGAFGTCHVRGTVARVERGTTYQPGQGVEIGVPCTKPGARPPLGGIIYREVADLERARYGRAYLGADGALALSQYEPLDALP